MPSGVDLILGMDWLRHHGLNLDCERNECSFSVKCQRKALRPSRSDPQMPQISSTFEVFKSSAKGKKGAATWLMLVQSDDPNASISPSGVTATAAGASRPFDSSCLLPDEKFDLNHPIRRQEGATPTYRRPYRLSSIEQREVEKQISEF
eukprot:1139699-Pelagomonas_calceolata.AAC.4